MCFREILLCMPLDSLQCEGAPFGPRTVAGDRKQLVRAVAAIGIQLSAQDENGLTQQSKLAEKQRNQDAPKLIVAVKEGMYRLKLLVHNGYFQQRSCSSPLCTGDRQRLLTGCDCTGATGKLTADSILP